MRNIYDILFTDEFKDKHLKKRNLTEDKVISIVENIRKSVKNIDFTISTEEYYDMSNGVIKSTPEIVAKSVSTDGYNSLFVGADLFEIIDGNISFTEIGFITGSIANPDKISIWENNTEFTYEDGAGYALYSYVIESSLGLPPNKTDSISIRVGAAGSLEALNHVSFARYSTGPDSKVTSWEYLPSYELTDEEVQKIKEWLENYLRNISGYIKYRVLDNRQRLTPKTDFVYGVYGNTTTDNVSIYNIDGTIKKEIIRWRHGETISVGKGQYISFNNKEVNGINTLVLQLFNKLDDTLVEEEFVVDSTDNGYTSYYKTKSIATFLGKPFISKGDNDRYIIVVQNTTTDNGMYYPSLFNIDKWEWKNPRTTAGYNIYYDMVFDGVDTVYVCYDGDRIQVANISNWYDDRTTLGELFDNAGERTLATKIYGVNQTEVIYKATTGSLKRHVLSTGETFVVGGDGSNPILNCVMSPIIKEDGDDYLLLGFQAGQIYFRNTTNTKTYNLSQRLTELGIIEGNEVYLLPLLITNFEETETEIKFTWILGRVFSNDSYWKSIETTINKSAGSTTDILKGAGYNGTTTNLEQIINSFANSCNSYGVGTFYNYGLQKQWNNRE